MPLKSLQVLKWGPDYRHYKRYSRYDESDPDEYDQPTNVWDAVSLLHFTPMLQHFQSTDYYASNFGENPFPKNKLVLQFLTVLECASVLCDEKFGQWMLEFLKCTPMLKTIRCAELGDPYVDVSKKLKESLRLTVQPIQAIKTENTKQDRKAMNRLIKNKGNKSDNATWGAQAAQFKVTKNIWRQQPKCTHPN
ncbi:Protein of unknown function [Pyronema omphalodes CBS 100304]|uniref:Uncharacterized protein n=1 Tax=Pyronema omphalodes (strain CBS 100304) TaxID=1076935 RepID=U4LDZ9_PYROM|nr:Protein of unknown function [Pyronema omphalodes CBS 100304]